MNELAFWVVGGLCIAQAFFLQFMLLLRDGFLPLSQHRKGQHN